MIIDESTINAIFDLGERTGSMLEQIRNKHKNTVRTYEATIKSLEEENNKLRSSVLGPSILNDRAGSLVSNQLDASQYNAVKGREIGDE